MQIKGKILDFDRVYNIAGTRNYYFPKDAVIDIPEKIPIVLEFRMDANNVLGHGVITRDDEGHYLHPF